MKFYISKIYIFIFLFALLFTYQPVFAAEPDLTAESAILIDARTGRVLYAKNENEHRPMASTTKITTALLALERGKLSDVVTISKRAAETGEASIWLEEGEKQTLEDLLYAMLLPSANDAAVAIAEHIGGSVENFAGMMNDRVKKLGLKDTHYVTPNGLHDPNHYTTAHDLAFVAREALKIPEFREIIKTKRREIPWVSSEYPRALINKNKLLYNYPYAIGVKNGYTRQAGNCLVGAAEKDGMTLIAVVMKSNHMYDETQELLEYGFENYKPLKIVSRGEEVRKIDVINGTKPKVQVVYSKDIVIPVKSEETKNIKKNLQVVQALQAPIKPGSKAGSLEVILNNKPFAKIDLLTSEGAEAPITFKKTLWDTFILFLKFMT